MIYNQRIKPENTKGNRTGSIFHHHFIRESIFGCRKFADSTISTLQAIIIFGFGRSVDEIIIEWNQNLMEATLPLMLERRVPARSDTKQMLFDLSIFEPPKKQATAKDCTT